MNRILKIGLFALAVWLVSPAAAQAPADWANFGRFEAENLTAPQHPGVVFMGDSIFELWENTHPDFFTANGYLNRAISGQTTSQMLVRFRADVIEQQPRVVVICGGTNDFALNTGYISSEHMFDNIQSMVELARANGILPILCSVLPTGDYGWRPGQEPAPKIIRFNEALRAYAAEEKIPYVDFHTPMAAPDGSMIAAYTYDGVHPTAAGYAVMEQVLKPVIDKKVPKGRKAKTR